MKVILTSIGTRGDMEPLLAIAEILQENGHDVLCLFPEQFRDLAEDSGFRFYSLGSRFIELLSSPAGMIAMGGGKFGIKKIRAYITLIKNQKSINKEMIIKQEDCIESEIPDIIVHNGKVIYPVIWSLKNKGKSILVCPVPYLHYVKNHSHVAFHSNYGPLLNKLSYKIANYGLVKTIMSSTKWLKEHKKYKQKDIQGALFNNETIYTVSPTLFQRPNYWPENLKVLGYHERKKTSHWKPSEELLAFLDSHDKVLFVTFGSMINSDPMKKTEIILSTLQKLHIPAIINTASGGLVKPANYNQQLFHYVERIPYDYIFPKMYGIIHHGGSGTTHTALKNGCASLIIPHIIDQYVWNNIVSEKSAGPKGVDISKINRRNMERLITDLYSNLTYKKHAEKLGESMLNEDYRKALHDGIIRKTKVQ